MLIMALKCPSDFKYEAKWDCTKEDPSLRCPDCWRRETWSAKN